MTSTETPINGRELTPEELAEKNNTEKGTSFDWADWPKGVDIDGEVTTEFPDREWSSAVEEMLRTDGQASAVLTALTMPLRMANTSIEKPDGPNAKRITDWVETALLAREWDGGMSTPLPTVIGQMTRARAMRRSYHEKVFTRGSDGKIVYSKLAWRPPASCHLMRAVRNGDILGFKQWQDPFLTPDYDLDKEGFVVIERPAALVYIHGQHIDPLYGWSDMNVAKWAYEQKVKLVRLWFRYADRQSMPKTLVYGKDPVAARKNAQAVAALGGAGVAGITRNSPDEKMFDVLDNSGGGSAHAVFSDMARYLDGMMSRSVMASWLDLPSAAGNGAGSYALSADQSGIFMQGTFAVAQEIADLITARVIAPLVRVNFGPKAPVPRFVFEKIDSDQSDRMLQLVSATATAQNGPQMPEGIFRMMVEKLMQSFNLDDTKVRHVLEQEPTADQRAEKQAQMEAQAKAGPGEGPGAPEAVAEDAGPTPTPAAVGNDGKRLADTIKAAGIVLAREGK